VHISFCALGIASEYKKLKNTVLVTSYPKISLMWLFQYHWLKEQKQLCDAFNINETLNSFWGGKN
jgi:hypothetical protein